jgi:hypothetical protein
MVIFLVRSRHSWRPRASFPNLPVAEAALLRPAARGQAKGRKAEVVGSLLLIDEREALAITVTGKPCPEPWARPAGLPLEWKGGWS